MEIVYRCYCGEAEDLDKVTNLIDKELSEPYSIFTYRYFVSQWPKLCILAICDEGDAMEDGKRKTKCVGVIVCKSEMHRPKSNCVGFAFDCTSGKENGKMRGYIAMLVVDLPHRQKGVGSELLNKALQAMRNDGCEEVVLEAEVSNKAALGFYSRFGFLKDKRLNRYYLNGQDAFRLKLFLIPDRQESSIDCDNHKEDVCCAAGERLEDLCM